MTQVRHEYAGNTEIWFELPDDITQGQLEDYETSARTMVAKQDEELHTDSFLARVAIISAFAGKFIGESEGVPTNKKELSDASAKVTWWMAREIATFIAGLKTPDPN